MTAPLDQFSAQRPRYGLLGSLPGAKKVPKGNLAGVLVPTGTDVALEHLKSALQSSFQHRRVVKLTRREQFLAVKRGDSTAPSVFGVDSTDGGLSTSATKKGPPSSPTIGTNATSNKRFKIFCDLDGVLADFEQGVLQKTGLPIDGQSRDKLWQKINNSSGFFETLPVVDGALEFWDELCALPATVQPPTILTGLPLLAKKTVHKEKARWCRQHLHLPGRLPEDALSEGGDGPQEVPVQTCLSHKKGELWSGPGCVLIDDAAERRKEWTMYGGLFIHHVSFARTLYELRRAILGTTGETIRVPTPTTWVDADAFLAGALVGDEAALGKGTLCVEGTSTLGRNSLDLCAEEFPTELEQLTRSSRSQPADHFPIVAIDCEWTEHSELSVVQVAVPPITRSAPRGVRGAGAAGIRVWLFDVKHASLSVRDGLKALCQSRRVWKVGFALDADAQRLSAALGILELAGVVDLQELAKDLLVLGRGSSSSSSSSDCGGGSSSAPVVPLKGSNLSFSALVSTVLGVHNLDKGKSLQHSDWDARPLSPEQLRYAAADAAFAVAVWERLCELVREDSDSGKRKGRVLAELFPAKTIVPDPWRAKRAAKRAAGGAELDTEIFSLHREVEPVFSAVFLDPASREKLLQFCGTPQFRTVRCDHVTLSSKPGERELRGLPVGEACRIVVCAEDVMRGEGVDAIAVRELDVVNSVAKKDMDHSHEGSCSSGGRSLLPMVRSGFPHITLSTASGVGPDAALTLLEAGDLPPTPAGSPDSRSTSRRTQNKNILVLHGIVGLTVALRPLDPLAPLPNKVAAKLRAFLDDANQGDQLKFGKDELTSADRHVLHTLCEKNLIYGKYVLESRSEGREGARRLILAVKKVLVASNSGDTGGDGAEDDEQDVRVFGSGGQAVDEEHLARRQLRAQTKTKRVTDRSRFESLNLVFGKTSSEGAKFAGAVSLDSFVRDHFREKDADLSPDVIILRGLPGSGKSSLATILGGARTICSADRFFELGGGLSKRELRRKKFSGVLVADDAEGVYQQTFSEDRLKEAHDWCFGEFVRAVDELKVEHEQEEGGNRDISLCQPHRVVVVDNTNSTLKEYSMYRKHAEKHGLNTQVVELVCASREEALRFNRRGTHSVPVKAVMIMLSRWEADPAAVLVWPAVAAVSSSTGVGGSEVPSAGTNDGGMIVATSMRTTSHEYGGGEDRPLLSSSNKRDCSRTTAPIEEYLPEEFLTGCSSYSSPHRSSVNHSLISPFPQKSLAAWLSDNHLLHYSKSRAKTHLIPQIGEKSPVFVHVPQKLRQDFEWRFSQAFSAGEELVYLIELLPEGREARFRMFFDVDLPNSRETMGKVPLSAGELRFLVEVVERVCYRAGVSAFSSCSSGKMEGGRAVGAEETSVGSAGGQEETIGGVAGTSGHESLVPPKVLITGYNHPSDTERIGLHIRLPRLLVNRTEALALRGLLVSNLSRACVDLEGGVARRLARVRWAEVIDGQVYGSVEKGSSGSLRMFGARKATKGVDRGRVYSLLAASLEVSDVKQVGLSDLARWTGLVGTEVL